MQMGARFIESGRKNGFCVEINRNLIIYPSRIWLKYDYSRIRLNVAIDLNS